MPDVIMRVKWVVEGQQAIRTSTQQLQNLNETHKEQAKTMREFNPILQQFGVGFLGAATGIGVAIGGMALLTKSLIDYIKTQKEATQAYNDYLNITTGARINSEQAFANLKALRTTTGFSEKDISEAFGAISQAIPDQKAAESAYRQAAQVSRDTNKNVVDVARMLAEGYSSGATIGGQRYTPGMSAYNAILSQLEAEASPTSKGFGGLKSRWTAFTGDITPTEDKSIIQRAFEALIGSSSTIQNVPLNNTPSQINVYIDGVLQSQMEGLQTHVNLRGGGD